MALLRSAIEVLFWAINISLLMERKRIWGEVRQGWRSGARYLHLVQDVFCLSVTSCGGGVASLGTTYASSLRRR